MKTQDFLIVGQGLAGSFLAWQLLRRGCSVVVADDPHGPCASLAAAGMINPIMGRRLILSPGCEELLPYAKEVYRQLEQKFKRRFFEDREIIRLFRNEEELREWDNRRAQTRHKHYYGHKQPPGTYAPVLNDELGSFIIRKGGFCHKQELMAAFRRWFIERGVLINKAVDPAHWASPAAEGVWQGQAFDRVIFCEGYQVMGNPLFDWIPGAHAKGEILTLRLTQGELPPAVISCGKWLIPTGEGRFTAGATYSWDDLDDTLHEDRRQEIIADIRRFVRGPFEVVDHTSGVRPIMLDRQPVLGMHPALPRVGVFNGLASKGLIWGPYYAAQMAEFLINGRSVDTVVDIQRFAGRL